VSKRRRVSAPERSRIRNECFFARNKRADNGAVDARMRAVAKVLPQTPLGTLTRICLEMLRLCGESRRMPTEPAVILAEPSGVIRSWNSGAEALFGHAAADAIGQKLDLIVPLEFRERHWAGYRAAMAAGDGNIDHGAFNIPALHRDGTVMRVEVRLMVLHDARNRAAGAMAVFVADDETAPPLPRL
jgi:PAS domain S-box-containing protein